MILMPELYFKCIVSGSCWSWQLPGCVWWVFFVFSFFWLKSMIMYHNYGLCCKNHYTRLVSILLIPRNSQRGVIYIGTHSKNYTCSQALPFFCLSSLWHLSCYPAQPKCFIVLLPGYCISIPFPSNLYDTGRKIQHLTLIALILHCYNLTSER